MRGIFVKSVKSKLKNLSSQEGRYISNIGKLLLFSIFILFFLSSIKPVLSVEFDSCSSGGSDGFCEKYKTCICTISGECTNGNLLVYQGELSNPLCSPEIDKNSVSIDWDSCNITKLSFINVRADCDEGQSAEKTIKLVLETTTTSLFTTTSTTTLEETTTITNENTNTCGGNGYCEDITAECKSGYYYCSKNNEECPEFPYNEKCCCKPTNLGWPFKTIVVLIASAVMVGVIVFLFFTSRMKKDTTFKKLYRKWNK
jgi:hypothetical protein